MKQHSKLIHVHPDFHKELKIASAETGKHMEEITKEIAAEFRTKRTGIKKNEYFI